MRKLLAMIAMAVVCLFGASQSTIISHAKSTWQVETPKEETQGGVTYYTYPNADGQTCWLYEIKAGENADIKTLTIPETIGGLTVTRLGTDIEDKNLFGDLELNKSVRQKIFDNISKPVYKDEDSGAYITAL